MKNYSIIFLLFSFALVLFGVKLNAQDNSLNNKNNKRIEGTYEFVSKEISINKPFKEVFHFTPPKWKGMWQIYNGYFSSVLMQEERNSFFECEKRDLGYDSFAGNYTVEENEIMFKQNYSLHPFYKRRPVVMQYRIEKDKLILTQTLHPTLEDMREGSLKIILRKLPN